MNKSIWNKNINSKIEYKNFKEIDTDVLIIGAGITGMTLGYLLRDSKYKITLIDKGMIGSGITGKTTAKISYLQDIIYQRLYNYFGYDVAKNYYNSQIDGIKIILKIIKDNKIDCDLERCDSVLFTLDDKNIKKIQKEMDLIRSFGGLVSEVNHKKIKAGISVSDTYSFNPIKYLDGIKKIISKKVDIYEGILAKDISKFGNKYIVNTNSGRIIAKKVVVACHYPFFLLPGLYPIKTYVKREYVNAGIIDSKKDYMAINIDKELHSIRFYDNYLIYTSNSHRITSKIDYKLNYDKSRYDFKKYFGINPKYSWMNQDMISNDSLPFIGEIKNNLFISCGYNAWGMTNGTIGAKIISEIILHGDSRYQDLFNPKRINLLMVVNSFMGIFHYLKSYIEPLFKRNNPDYIKIDGLLYGVYVDKNGKRHVVKLICPHMKCNLVFNREEETWDCPCHGSRFDLDGNIINGPAKEDIRN